MKDMAKYIPLAYSRWMHGGQESCQVSCAYKHALLHLCMEQWHLHTMVETGIYMGDTIGCFRHFFEHIYSIEINPDYYAAACRKFKDCANVHLIYGDSALELPKLLPKLQSPILFWLDAHLDKWCGPVIKELEAIYASGLKGVILVDDMDFISDTLPKDSRWPQEYLNGVVRMVNVLDR